MEKKQSEINERFEAILNEPEFFSINGLLKPEALSAMQQAYNLDRESPPVTDKDKLPSKPVRKLDDGETIICGQTCGCVDERLCLFNSDGTLKKAVTGTAEEAAKEYSESLDFKDANIPKALRLGFTKGAQWQASAQSTTIERLTKALEEIVDLDTLFVIKLKRIASEALESIKPK